MESSYFKREDLESILSGLASEDYMDIIITLKLLKTVNPGNIDPSCLYDFSYVMSILEIGYGKNIEFKNVSNNLDEVIKELSPLTVYWRLYRTERY